MRRPSVVLAEEERVRQEQRRNGNITRNPRTGIVETSLSRLSNVTIFDHRVVHLANEIYMCAQQSKQTPLRALTVLLFFMFILLVMVLGDDDDPLSFFLWFGLLFVFLLPVWVSHFHWNRRLDIARMKVQAFPNIHSIPSEIVLPTFSGSVIFGSARVPHQTSDEEWAWLAFQLNVALGIIHNDQTRSFGYADEDAMERALRNNGIQFQRTLSRNARKRWVRFTFSSSSSSASSSSSSSSSSPSCPHSSSLQTKMNPNKQKQPKRQLKASSKILYDCIPTEDEENAHQTNVECAVACSNPTNSSIASSNNDDNNNNNVNNTHQAEDIKLASKPMEQQSTKTTETTDTVESCTICLLPYKDGQSLIKLPCSHIFHAHCISKWCRDHIRCPLCNFDLEKKPQPKKKNVCPLPTTTTTLEEAESIVDNNDISPLLSNVDSATRTTLEEAKSIVDNNGIV